MKQEGGVLQAEEYLDPTANTSKQLDGSISSHQKAGHWSDNEHQLYLEFLGKVRGENTYRKGQPLFKKMSEIIGTRSPSQCRSHHQKFNPFNPLIKKNKKKNKKHKIILEKKPIMRSKQVIRRYFALNKETADEE